MGKEWAAERLLSWGDGWEMEGKAGPGLKKGVAYQKREKDHGGGFSDLLHGCKE